jgi:hypothetical protein
MGSGKFSPSRVSSIGEFLGYRPTWMADTKETLESELRSRGIAPQAPPDHETPAAGPNRTTRSITSVLMRLLLGAFVVGIAAWLLYKNILG